MANTIDIIINALWRGGGATGRAQQELRNLGTAASTAQVELAAAASRSGLLQSKMGDLGKQVALGNLTVEEAQQQYNQFAGSLSTVGTTAQKQGVTFASLATKIGVATIAFGTAAVAARRFGRALEEGAGLELTAQRFDRLARSIGTTGAVLQSEIVDASAGMVSNAQAMSLATDLLALDLANTSDEAVRFSRVVTELDQDIGELVLALSNQTTRRFDQLGVSVEGFDERLEALKGTMSDERAFTMAFLEQAEAQIEKVGGASQTTAGDIRRMQADIDNLKTSAQVALVEGLGPLLRVLSGRAEQEAGALVQNIIDDAEIGDIEAATEAMAKLREERDRLGQPTGGFTPSLLPFDSIIDQKKLDQLDEFDNAMVSLARTVAQSSDSLPEFRRNLEAVGFQMQIGYENGRLVENALIQVGNEVHNTGELFEEANKPIDEHGEALQEAHDRMIDARNASEGLGDEVEDQAGAWNTLASSVQGAISALREVGAALGEEQLSPFEFAASVIDRTERLNELRQETLADFTQDRADLWTDFQDDLTDITIDENSQRLQITQQYESQRTDLIESYAQQVLQAEADFARQRQRQADQLALDIADVRDDSGERREELREDANRRLEELEEDHLRRMQQIVDDAAFDLADAAGRLDAAQTAAIVRDRDRALEREEQAYADQRQEIIETVERRLQEEREAEEKRIQELRERNARRQQIEQEDFELRMERLEDQHQDRLDTLDEQHTERLRQIDRQAQSERDERERQYRLDYNQLGGYWGSRRELEFEQQQLALQEQALYWQQARALITGATGGSTGPGPFYDPAEPGSDPGTSSSRPDKEELINDYAIPAMQQAGWEGGDIVRRIGQLQFMTEQDIADWIEDTFRIDVPGYLLGTPYVPRTGLAMLHEGEAVLTRQEARTYRQGGNVTIQNNIYPSPGMDEQRLAELTAKTTDERLQRYMEAL